MTSFLSLCGHHAEVNMPLTSAAVWHHDAPVAESNSMTRLSECDVLQQGVVGLLLRAAAAVLHERRVAAIAAG